MSADITQSPAQGTRVTAQPLDGSEPESRVILNDSSVQAYPKSGTHVITVKNVGGAR